MNDSLHTTNTDLYYTRRFARGVLAKPEEDGDTPGKFWGDFGMKEMIVVQDLHIERLEDEIAELKKQLEGTDND